MGYYDDWDEGREFVFDEPTPDQLNDWNIHNDHQDYNFESEDEMPLCDCGDLFIPNWSQVDCDACMTRYWRNNPDPADIAEREELENRSDGLEIPWEGEF